MFTGKLIPWQSGVWRRKSLCLLAFATLSIPWVLQAGSIGVPNGSFESPVTDFVDIHVDSWQKAAKPSWYDEINNGPWDQLIGTFKNTTNTSPDHIDNCDGNQAIWMFAVPEVALFQDYNSMDWNDQAPTHNFNALYEVGKSYHLTVGVIGGGYSMLQGVSLQLCLYYRDTASNQVPVGLASVTYSNAVFSNRTHFVDFKVDVPAVKATDAWAGQNIGIQILSTVSSNLEGGYWDLDNVRLSSIREPVLQNPVFTNGQFNFTLQSEPGLKLEMLAAGNLASNWVSLGTLTNATGTVSFTNTPAGFSRRFYQARKIQ
jgi:hypothetical protein